jgi:hypothetical protein
VRLFIVISLEALMNNFRTTALHFFLQKNCEALVKRLSGQGNISVGLRFHWRGPGGFAPDPLLDFGSIDGRGQPHHASRDHPAEAVAGLLLPHGFSYGSTCHQWRQTAKGMSATTDTDAIAWSWVRTITQHSRAILIQ